jgi:NADH-ubiquinone oxidoreductase chain 4
MLYFLPLIILIPIIGCILLIIFDNNIKNTLIDTKKNNLRLKQIALNTSIINFFISLFIWFNFDSNISQYQYVLEFNQLNLFHFNFGLDGISMYFVLLTTFITPIALLSNYSNIIGNEKENLKFFLILILLLESLQICAFVALDLLLFYIFFESVLPVLFILILIFGHGEDRFRSAFLFFLYTLAGSLPMLLSIILIYSYVGSTDFNLIFNIEFNFQILLFVGFFIAFAVKTPLLPFIIWLPKAHADSVLAGSIILAGTILKLATYGYLRILLNMLSEASFYFSSFIQTIAIVTLILSSLSTIIQQDTKRLIAYSSIAHMSVVILGLFSNTIIGIQGAILLSIAHGFVSPALFIAVGGVIMDRFHTRIINDIRGLVTFMPIFTIFFFIFSLANTGIPLSLNFLGEQMSLIGIWEKSPIISILGATGIVLSACYSLFLYNRLSYGYTSNINQTLIAKDLNRREFYLFIALLIPTFVLGILPNVILETLDSSVTPLIF